MINNLEDKSARELREIVLIQIEEAQKQQAENKEYRKKYNKSCASWRSQFDNMHQRAMASELENKKLQAESGRLLKACDSIQDDLLMRGDSDDDGTRAVNVSSSIWNEFCDALVQAKEQGESNDQ